MSEKTIYSPNEQPLACPFCGSKSTHLSEEDEVFYCYDCQARGPSNWEAFECNGAELTPIGMWNMRRICKHKRIK